MKLSQLRSTLEQARTLNWSDPDVLGITQDSRRVQPGYLFVACVETHGDGHDFVPDAVRNGAAALVVQHKAAVSESIPQIVVPDSHAALATLADCFYEHPSQHLALVGVTGTSGKTTTTRLIDGILVAAGRPTGLLGTITYRIGRREIPAGMTTPMSNEVQAMLREMVDEGVTTAVMEVSSHALMQHRVDHCRFAGAVFTNLTHEHLDYHKTIDAYCQAKSRLFTGLDAEATAVMNVDDPSWRKVLGKSPARVVTYGLDNPADVRGWIQTSDLEGSRFKVESPWGKFDCQTTLVGRYNVGNCLAALAVCGSLGVPVEDLRRGLRSVRGVPGRLERVEAGQPYVVLVDYAHKEDALRKVLGTLRELTTGRVIVVFGCGGDRDRAKRPLMGRAAEELADIQVITSDNPRSEEPLAIIEEIISGIRTLTHVTVEPDRERAIRIALAQARPGDVVLIAGKGHETTQKFHHHEIHFDDREVVRNLLRETGFHA